MGFENDFDRLVEAAPEVTCPRCSVDMPVRSLVPVAAQSQDFTAIYRCPKCGTETQREFTVSP